MPEIEPFRGLIYDTSKVEASKVLAPPYDVIDGDEHAALAARDPHNCVRLILPEGEGDGKYATAAGLLDSWLSDGTLLRDDRPAIYRYHQVFKIAEIPDRTFTRKGFIAAVRLHAFDEGQILPHERTLKGPKIDRLKLMDATGAHFSQIFTLYSDPSQRTDQVFKRAEVAAPYLEAETDDGTLHRMWRVYDREIIGELQRQMAQKKLYIADGHHRYETMLAQRDNYRAANKDLGYKSAAQFGTMFCANMNDAGLVVLPTHRLVHNLDTFDRADMIERARPFFEISTLERGAIDVDELKKELARLGESRAAFAAIVPGSDHATLFALAGGADLRGAGLTGSHSLLELDVTLLHELVLERILGIDKAKQEAKTHIKYIKKTPEALERTRAGEGQVCFVMNPTRLPQIKAVANAGEFMPQKSTYFYPKIASGVVFRSVDPGEELY